MSNFSSHSRAGLIAGAVATIVAFIVSEQFEHSLLYGFVAYVGAVFPDLDVDSIPSRWAARIGFTSSFILLMLNKPYPAAIAGLFFFLVKSGKHRGLTHKYWLPASCLALGAFTGNLLFMAFGAGLIVHLWLDGIKPWAWANWV